MSGLGLDALQQNMAHASNVKSVDLQAFIRTVQPKLCPQHAYASHLPDLHFVLAGVG